MQKTFKKSVSILLAVIMILSVFTIVPMSAGATSPAASVNDTTYETFEEAVAARANDTDVITLLANYSGTYVMDPGTLKVKNNGFTFAKPTVEGAYIVSQTVADDVSTYTTAAATVKHTNTAGTVVTYYTEANLNALNNGTYQLLADVTRTQRMAYGTFASNVTLDLNGYTLTSSASDCAITLGRGGSASSPKVFALVDTSTNGGGKLVFTTDPSASTAAIRVGAKYNNITIGEGATVEGGAVALLSENQSLTVNGTINGGDDFAIVTNGASTKNATVTVNDGAVVTADEIAMYLPGTGTTTINGGTITGGTAIYVKSGTLDIKGGTITGNGAAAEYTYDGSGANATGDAIVVDSCGYPGGAPAVTISNGTLTSEHADAIGAYDEDTTDETEPEIAVSGGTFSSEVPAEYCANGFVPADDGSGNYGVEKAKSVQAYDGEGTLIGVYTTINDAIEAGGNGCTVKLIADLYEQQQINSQMSPVTFDLNGHVIHVNGGAGLNFSMGYYWNGDHIFTIVDTVGGGGIDITPRYTGNACISDNTGRTIIVEGGTFTSTGKAVYCTASNATFTINGGTFEGEVYVHDTGYGHGELAITNGSFSGAVSATGDAVIAISGGTFDTDVSEYTTVTTYQNASGAVVAKVANRIYDAYDFAQAAAEGGKWYIDADSVNGDGVTVTADLNIYIDDGKDHTITGNIAVAEGVTLAKYGSNKTNNKKHIYFTGTATLNGGIVKNANFDTIIVANDTYFHDQIVNVPSGAEIYDKDGDRIVYDAISLAYAAVHGSEVYLVDDITDMYMTMNVNSGTFILHGNDHTVNFTIKGDYASAIDKTANIAIEDLTVTVAPGKALKSFIQTKSTDDTTSVVTIDGVSATGFSTDAVYTGYGEWNFENAIVTSTTEPDCPLGWKATDKQDGTWEITVDDLGLKHSISLNGDIALNYYLNPALVEVGNTVNFTWEVNGAEKSDSYIVKATDLDPLNGYKVSVSLPAAEMTSTVRATVNNSELFDDYSVRAYCNVILADPTSSEELVDLVKTMLKYGAMAQVVWGINETSMADANIDYDMPDELTDVMIDNAIKAANNGFACNLGYLTNEFASTFFTTSLSFLSECTLRHYFFNAADCNAEQWDGSVDDYFCYVEQTDIAAADLDKLYDFTVDGITFQYSALDYVKEVINNDRMTVNAKNLAKATFWYNQAANAFFG